MPSTSTASLTGRSFLRELDFTPAEWASLVDLARVLKAERAEGREVQRLVGRTMALVFEKTSTRTRCAFEVAAYLQGGHVTVLEPAGSQFGHKESIADTARVLGQFFDGIEYRGTAQETVETMARYAGVPVWNGLTDEWHPTQGLCDSVTMLEHAGKPAEDIAFAYVGDARFNVGNSLLVAGALLGMDVRVVAPPSLQPAPEVLEAARDVAAGTGARLTVTDDLTGVEGVDFVHTDVWVSMGEPKDVWTERAKLLAPYQVNAELLAATGMTNGLEVTDDVFRSPASIVFDQAENRLHTIKAVLVATLA